MEIVVGRSSFAKPQNPATKDTEYHEEKMRPLQPGSQQGLDSGEKGLDDPPASVNGYAEAGAEVQSDICATTWRQL